MDLLSRSPGQLSVAAFTAYPWEHVLPTLRLVEPLRLAGIALIQGNDMDQVAPEKVSLADMVVIQRDFPRWETAYQAVIQLARSEGKPVIYEVDDLLLELPEDHPDRPIYYYSRTLLPMLRAILEADAVTASTPALRDYLLPFNPNVLLLPNYLVDDLWPPQASNIGSHTTAQADEGPLTIGYMGTTSHTADLEMISDVLQTVLDHYGEHLILHFWGIQPPAGLRSHPSVQWTPLQILDYSQFAAYFSQQKCDVFLAPLAVNRFNQVKSSIKYLEYSALGVPGVYSRITPYESIVRHAETGMLASTPDEWEYCLHQLIDNPSLRVKIGSQANQAVNQSWRLSGHADEWRTVYKQVALKDFASNPADSNRRMSFSSMLNQLQEWQAELEDRIVQERQVIQNLHSVISEKELQIQQQASLIQQQASLIQELRTRLDEIYHSRAGKITRSMWRLHLLLAPPGSRRERLWHKLTSSKNQADAIPTQETPDDS